MRRYTLARLAGALLLGAAPLVWSGAAAAEMKELRVCADPFTLPYSNRQMEGFENRIAEVIARAMEHAGPVVIDFQVKYDENCYPMVPPGASLDETIDQPAWAPDKVLVG